MNKSGLKKKKKRNDDLPPSNQHHGILAQILALKPELIDLSPTLTKKHYGTTLSPVKSQPNLL